MNYKKRPFFIELEKYRPIIHAISELFYPFLEVAVHDLKTRKIVLLENCLSKRNVGDFSPLPELIEQSKDNLPDYFPPYRKLNYNGKGLKCTTITIRDFQGKALGLICFNFNIAPFAGVQELIDQLVKSREEAESPVEKYGGDAHKKISKAINDYLKTERLVLEQISREEKRRIVQSLYQQGIFNYKNAPALISQKLNISRASIYNYLES